MTLKDHFAEPLASTISWESVHSLWISSIAMELNRLLPPGYRALPTSKRGTGMEIDVATIERYRDLAKNLEWKPEAPAWSTVLTFPELDVFEIQIAQLGTSSRKAPVVAAIELVSPANKDRPLNRIAFAGKCAGYLRMGIGVIVVDVVTERRQNLHELLLELLELEPAKVTPDIRHELLYAVAYRTDWSDKPEYSPSRLEIWPHRLQINDELPTLPLWLKDAFAVPVDLAKTYTEVCESLMIE